MEKRTRAYQNRYSDHKLQKNPPDINKDQISGKNQLTSPATQLLFNKRIHSGWENDEVKAVYQQLIRAESLFYLARIENENIVGSLTWKFGSRLRFIIEGYQTISKLAYSLAGRFVFGHAKRVDQKTEYQKWLKAHDRLTPADCKAIGHQIQLMASPPLFSILFFVKQADKKNMKRSLSSVFGQLYPHWELLVLQESSVASKSKEAIEEALSTCGNNNTQSVRMLDISGLHHSARLLNQIKGEYIIFLQSGDRLALQALYMLAFAADCNARPDILYSDEDFIDQNDQRFAPYFKPDWNPDLFLSQNYIHNLCALKRIAINPNRQFSDLLDAHFSYNLLLSAIEHGNNENIVHLPFVLYHNSIDPEISKSTKVDPARFHGNSVAIEEYFSHNGINARIKQGVPKVGYRIQYLIPEPAPLISIIIPTAGYKMGILSRLMKDLIRNTSYAPIEILIVVNNIYKSKRLAAIKAFEAFDQVRILEYDGPFNHSSINNYARQFVSGTLLCFLNDDIRTIHPTWLTEMVSHALRPEIGAVGAKLYYPNNLIQHAGVILGCGGNADHVFRGNQRRGDDYFQNMHLTRNYSAVTAACMVMRKNIFDTVAGFDESLTVAFNDVDICLKIREKGYRTLWTPYAELFHYDSLSRKTMIPSLQAKIRQDMETLQQRWAPELIADPAFNPNLCLRSDFFILADLPRIHKPWKSDL